MILNIITMENSKFQYLIESQDNYKNLGYDYKGNIFKNMISSYVYYNNKLQPLILKFEDMAQVMIKQVKTIKKHYNFAIRKDNNNFN